MIDRRSPVVTATAAGPTGRAGGRWASERVGGSVAREGVRWEDGGREWGEWGSEGANVGELLPSLISVALPPFLTEPQPLPRPLPRCTLDHEGPL